MTAPLILLIFITSVLAFCIGLVYLSRNIKLPVRLYFSLAITFAILWVTTLYCSNLDTPWTLYFNRIVFACPVVALVFFGLFIDSYYFGNRRLRSINVLSVGIGLVGVVASLSPLGIQGVHERLQDGRFVGFDVVPGPLYAVIAVILLLLSISLFARILLAYQLVNGAKKRPLRLIVYALVLLLTVSTATNVFAPIIIGGSSLGNIASNITIFIFGATVAYSVLKYSFLDIRSLVVRSVGYVAGLTTILALVGLAQLFLFRSIGGDEATLTVHQQVIILVLFCVATVILHPLQVLFSKVTSSFLFRDRYEPAKIISAFNDTMARNIQIDVLLRKSAMLIQENFRADFCVIEVEETAHTPRYDIGTTQSSLQLNKNEEEAALHTIDKVVVADLAERTAQLRPTLKFMHNNEIAVLVKLSVSSDAREPIGYIAIGSKKNGDIYNKTDVETLTIIANELVLAVQNALHFQEIQNFNATLQEKIDVATKKLRNTNEKLRLLDQTKDDFISMASHQLRTPLTAVKGYVSMVLDGDAGTIQPQQRKMLTQAFISAQRMVYLISDLLNVSRLRTGKFLIEPIASNLAKVVQDEVDQLRETAAARNLQLSYARPEQFPLFLLDETKLRQVIMNFIDNAIYYTPSGGQITVNLIEKPLAIEFTVVDNGIGVPRHEQPHLFTKFFRAHNAKRARPDGTGLGLFMAKKVIAAQGGSIIFRSQEDKGSTFGFSFAKEKLLPTSAASVSAAEQPKNKDV